jgi:hypothetical protein
VFRGRDKEPPWGLDPIETEREARQKGTIFLPASKSPLSFAEVWERSYSSLGGLHAAFTRDGVLAVAVADGETLADYLHVPLADEPEFAVVGRHERCDLSVHLDPSLSLRHAVIGARASGGELRVRFLDLQSGSGFYTEDGQRCEALTADGAMFVRMGRYHLFLLPTGSLSPLPLAASAADAWDTIPERVYRDCRVSPRLPGAARVQRVVGPNGQTIITQIVEPPGMLRPLRPAAGARGARVARIELIAPAGSERFTLHEAELERGVLVGRYERCQLGSHDDKMSRVHLLIIRDGDRIWGIDTASTNGTQAGGEPVRKTLLRDGARLQLAKQIALVWHTDVGPDESTVETAPSPPPPADGGAVAP